MITFVSKLHSGHIGFVYHVFRKKIISDSYCECCVTQYVNHLFFECPNIEEIVEPCEIKLNKVIHILNMSPAAGLFRKFEYIFKFDQICERE